MILSRKDKLVSSVRQAIKDIKDTDNALSIIKKTVREQAIDAGNVNELETTLRKTLVTDINGGFQRYLVNFFSDKSLSIKDREELLLKLYVTMQEHFGNVKECIELYSQHSILDSATSMFYSKLSALERMLGQVEKKTQANRRLKEQEDEEEVKQVTDALRMSTNVLSTKERDSLNDPFQMDHQSYLIAQDTSAINLCTNYNVQDRPVAEDHSLVEHMDQGHKFLHASRDSIRNFDENENSLPQHLSKATKR